MFARIRRGWRIAKASWVARSCTPSCSSSRSFQDADGPHWSDRRVHVLGALAPGAPDGIPQKGQPAPPARLCGGVCVLLRVLLHRDLFQCGTGVLLHAGVRRMQAFAGKEPSLGAEMCTAAGRLPQILGWTLVAATVGVLLNVLQNTLRHRLGFLGAMLGGFIGFGWTLAAFFVVPVVVVDGLGPIAAVKRSAEILNAPGANRSAVGVASASLPLPHRCRPFLCSP